MTISKQAYDNALKQFEFVQHHSEYVTTGLCHLEKVYGKEWNKIIVEEVEERLHSIVDMIYRIITRDNNIGFLVP